MTRTIGRSAGLCVLILLLEALSACAGSVDESASQTLQNQKIYCWGHSADIGTGADRGETYPDHLGRLLGREVDHPTSSAYGSPPKMRAYTLDGTLEAASYFEEHKYGIIIIRGFKLREMDAPWSIVEDYIRKIIRKLQDTGAVVVLFEHTPIWNVSGQLTRTYDEENEDPWHFRTVYGAIGNETRTAKYIEWWGETVLSKIAREEGAFFLSDSLLDCLEEGYENCPRDLHDSGDCFFHPDLLSSDNRHPNNLGYGVWAERVAECLVDWGLADYAVDMDKLAQDLPRDLARSEEMTGALEERGHPLPEDLKKEYEMAKYLFGKGFPYTANRTLVGEALPRIAPVFENWDEIQKMFSQANKSIETLKQQADPRDIMLAEADYERARNAWADCDYDTTKMYLQRLPEPVLPHLLYILGLIMLPALLRRRKA